MMGDGSWQRGELVKPGDYVWNPVIKMPVKVIEISNGPEKPALLRFETAVGHKIRVTRNHPIPTKNGLKAAKDVLVGEHVRLMGGDFVEIKSVSYDSPEGSFVWNVRLDGSGKEEEMHYVLVDGVVAGDLTLQEQIETALKFTKIKGQ
jgi:intein/homing endonuclease